MRLRREQGNWEKGHLLLRTACFGLSSGLTFSVLVSTLVMWLADMSIRLDIIGLFAAVTLPYSAKIFLSPWIDSVALPYVTKKLGQRRSWALTTQILSVLAIIAMSFIDPKSSPHVLFTLALVMAFFAATQDTVLEALRIEMVPREEWQGLVSTAAYTGFRIGLWLSSYSSLVIAHYFSWSLALQSTAALLSIGIIAVVMSDEPKIRRTRLKAAAFGDLWALLKRNISSFFENYSMGMILLLVLGFKLSFVFSKEMWGPFLLSLYDKSEIAMIDKGIGMIAAIIGGAAGSLIMYRYGSRGGLFLWAILQSCVLLLLIWNVEQGRAVYSLMLITFIKQFVSGWGGTALITYFSSLCRSPDTGIQYAFLSSIGALGRIFVSILAGWCAAYVSWKTFFLISGVLSLPIIVIALFPQAYRKRTTKKPIK